MTTPDDKAIEARATIDVTFHATKEQIKAIGNKLFDETEFGTLVMMTAVEDFPSPPKDRP